MITVETEFHPEALLLSPLIGIVRGECGNPDCCAEHWMVTLGWLLWDVSFVFQFGGES